MCCVYVCMRLRVCVCVGEFVFERVDFQIFASCLFYCSAQFAPLVEVAVVYISAAAAAMCDCVCFWLAQGMRALALTLAAYACCIRATPAGDFVLRVIAYIRDTA